MDYKKMQSVLNAFPLAAQSLNRTTMLVSRALKSLQRKPAETLETRLITVFQPIIPQLAESTSCLPLEYQELLNTLAVSKETLTRTKLLRVEKSGEVREAYFAQQFGCGDYNLPLAEIAFKKARADSAYQVRALAVERILSKDVLTISEVCEVVAMSRYMEACLSSARAHALHVVRGQVLKELVAKGFSLDIENLFSSRG